MLGVTCFDCHVNGHTSAATHLVGDIRPQSHRRRLDTPSLRGVNNQRLFGSQRALKTIEDFTEFEQRAAYFDGDQVSAAAKGINPWSVAARSTSCPKCRSFSTSRPPPACRITAKTRPQKFGPDSLEMKGRNPVLRQSRVLHLPPGPVLHRQPDARPQS